MSENPSNKIELERTIEALLFVSGGSVPITIISETLGCTNGDVEVALKNLDDRYSVSSGLRIQTLTGRAQITTAPEYGEAVERFLGLEASSRLSRAAMETMAIIAYRSPVTRPGIDNIRGVNSDGVLHSLISKGLIQELGRSDGPGRPILYGITGDFLQHFGINSLTELPPYEIDDAESNAQDIFKD
jgi:segregation and condensation protein B